MTSPSSFQHLAPELRLFSGADSLSALVREIQRSKSGRALILSGRSVAKTPAMDELRAALGSTLAGESTAVRPNSPVSAVEEVVEALQQARADCVIAVGGGSAAVTARAASILFAEKQPARALCTRRLPSGAFESPRLSAPKIPQFVVPTTPSNAFVKAGSAVHDDATGERLALFDPKTRARGIFLHPAFLSTAPSSLVLSASLNTLSTTVEALESPKCDPVSEAMLLQALRLLAASLHQDDTASRERLAIAGVLCGRGTEQSGGGLASVLAHAIGHRVHAANGTVNAIVLPHTMRFNEPKTRDVSDRIALGLGATTGAKDAVAQLLTRANTPSRLRDIGLAREDLQAVVDAAMGDWFIQRAPRKVESPEQLLQLLEGAW